MVNTYCDVCKKEIKSGNICLSCLEKIKFEIDEVRKSLNKKEK